MKKGHKGKKGKKGKKGRKGKKGKYQKGGGISKQGRKMKAASKEYRKLPKSQKSKGKWQKIVTRHLKK